MKKFYCSAMIFLHLFFLHHEDGTPLLAYLLAVERKESGAGRVCMSPSGFFSDYQMGRRLKASLLPDGRPMVRNLPIHSWEIRLEMIDMALILIVGDEPDACRMLQRILLSFGHSVQAFTESEKAIRWLEDNVPDLTLVDIDSRGSDSIGVLEAIQNRRADNKAVMITGNLSAETARRAMELGIQDYLVKPVEIDELEEWVGKALGLIL